MVNLSPIPVSATYSQWPSFWVSVCENWVPDSIKDESWAECGNLALKELQTEICFCLTRMGHFKVSIVP